MNKEIILKRPTTLFANNKQTTGSRVTIYDMLFADPLEKDKKALSELNALNPGDKEKIRNIKDQLQLWSPSAELKSRAKGQTEIGELTGLMQLDIDYDECKCYDMDDLKRAFFALPFVFYVGLSCTGKGLFVLAVIEEPERLKDYFFLVADLLMTVGINIDRSKGASYTDLRYISKDPDALIKDEVKPLNVRRFNGKTSRLVKTLYEQDYEKNLKTAIPFVEAIESRELDFAPDYENYVKLGFALAEGTGESGRDLFHRCCQFSPKYNSEQADLQYSTCLDRLRIDGSGITFGSFIYWCKQLGLDSFIVFQNI